MSHPNEDRLRELYAIFAKGDVEGFLAGCTDDVVFTVPGRTPGSGTVTKATFLEWIGGVIGATAGTFQEHVLDVVANDEHGILQLHHEFDRDGAHREYRTAHVVEFRDGKIARWEEQPGSIQEFESAWGIADGAWYEHYLDAWNSRDGSQVAGFMADDVTYEDLALGVTHKGAQAVVAFVEETARFSSDYVFTAVGAQADGQHYCLEWEMAGTNDGAAGGVPATNRPYRIRGASVGTRNGDGLIATNRDYWNMADYLAQVGILPPPAAA
jgi:steroid delta-isomerase-like uncharacterized protein